MGGWYVAAHGQWRHPLGPDELRLRRRPGGELERHDPAPVRPERRLRLVGETRPGGGSPQVIDAVQMEEAVLVHVATDNERRRRGLEQERETPTALRWQEPVGRRASHVGVGPGQRLV